MPATDDQRVDPSDPRPGPVLAERYALGALLGSGGVGRVYTARDRKLQRDVAVKVLGSAAPDPDALRRFGREALAAGSVQHPNIVAVFDVGEEQGRPFIVTELLRGTTLREKLRKGPLAPEETLRIARQVAAGLAAAHEKGLTHRDLKPENLFLTDEGWVKILDFGLVKLTEQLHETAENSHGGDEVAVSTAAGRMLGTVGYMAPEQVRGRPVDPRADLFNFGAVLYEMLCGKRAFAAGSPTETGYAILCKQPEPLPASVPRHLRQLVERCLEKDREKRPASAREVLAALEATAAKAPLRRPRFAVRRRTLLAAGIAAVAAALLLAGLRGRKSRPVLPPSAPPSGTVAILPFSSRDAPRFSYLSEGMVDLLARDFEGGPLRAVDSASVLRALGGDSTSADLDKVRGASAQMGAKYFILGRVEDRAGDVVLEAVLHTSEGQPVSQAVVEGKPAELLRLLRKLSDQLQLRPLPPAEFEARLARLTRQTSRSPEALQAWLEGEGLLRHGHWNESAGAFQRAVGADSQFALAHYRLGEVAGMGEPGLAEDALHRALRYSDRLAPQERALVQGRIAVQEGRFGDAERIFLDATRLYPDDAECWMQLGELYFHSNPLRARSPQESTNAFQHVLVVDPLNIEAMSHLADLAQMRGERALVSRISDRLLAASDDPVKSVSYRLARAWARGDPTERDKVFAELRGADRSILQFAFVRTEWQMDGFSDADTVAAMFTGSSSPVDRAYGMQLVATLDLLRGRPDAARAELIRAANANPSSDSPYVAPWIDTLDFVPATPAQLAASRALAERIDGTRAPHLGPARLYLAAALAVRAGDAAAANRLARELERMPGFEASSITHDLALAVRARQLARQGNPSGALALLEKQQLRIPARYALSYSRISEPWLRATLLDSLGRRHEALPMYDAFTFYGSVNPIFVPMAHLRKARILAAEGDKGSAIEHYSRFIELWKNCEPVERPELDRARAELAQLQNVTPPRASR
ncbi:MAG TPA: protein kinase [Myxococcales bacterium]